MPEPPPKARCTRSARQPAASTAQVVWQTDLPPGNVQNTATQGPDGTLYVVNVAGVLFAIDSATGQVKWTAQIGNSQPAQFGQTVKVAPAVGPDGTVYVGALTGSLYAVTPPSGSGNQGSIKWNFDFGEHLGPTPLVTAPVTGRSEPRSGRHRHRRFGVHRSRWHDLYRRQQQQLLRDQSQRPTEVDVRSGARAGWHLDHRRAQLDSSTLYFGANKGGIYALNTQNGSLKWQFNIIGSVYGSPALDDGGTLYTGSTVGHVFSVATSSGDYITDLDLGAPVWSAPSVRPDGSIVVGDRNGRIVVLKG